MRRRVFLQRAALAGASGALGCGSGDVARGRRVPPDVGARAGGDAGLGGERVPFVDEAGPFGVAEGEGLNGRLYTDLSQLDAGQLLVDNAEFYVRTRHPEGLDPDAPWSLSLGGLVEQSVNVSLSELLELEQDQGVHLLECSGNFRGRGFGLMSAATWHGVPLDRLLEKATPALGAARLLVTGNDAHGDTPSNSTAGASWILSPEQLARTGSFLATRMNGVALPLDHGYPVRLVNPGWYGCSCIKWVQSVDWVADDTPSTSQMIEFASRTHQLGQPALARDYAAPEIQQAAMPIRVERAGAFYRVVGIVWGGLQPVQALGLSFDGGRTFESVPVAPGANGNRTWALWTHEWLPLAPGRYDLACRIEAPEVAMRRLDSGYYVRSVVIDRV